MPARRRYRISLADGSIEFVSGTFCFNNNGELVIRDGQPGATNIVAMASPGNWLSVTSEEENVSGSDDQEG